MFKIFKRTAKNWEQFARARKITIQFVSTESQARALCDDYNNTRSESQIRNGTKFEYERA